MIRRLIIVTVVASVCLFLQGSLSLSDSTTIKPKSVTSLAVTRNSLIQKLGDFSPNCSQGEILATKVDICAKPMMDMIHGTLDFWPQTTEEVPELCALFADSEKCVREVSRKCAKGLNKTIVSTVANSVHRVRKRECVKDKLPSLLKTVQCIEKNPEFLRGLMANVTLKLSAIENQVKDLDRTTSAICCMVHEIDREIDRITGAICPVEGKLIEKIFRGVVEDVLDIICRKPKCNDVFKGLIIPEKPNSGSMITLVLRLVFSIAV